ncbi:MAG: ABC transporter permease [Acidobacteriota bacterium]|nr:ABC transporter permease [Acidobacteriota bacterium]
MGSLIRRIRTLRSLVNGSRVKDDIQRELDLHIEMETEHRQRRGMSAEEARRTALRDFGGVSRIREEMHDSRGMTFWDGMLQDLRFAVRTLRRSPGYTAAAVLTLALGIGANTAMFSVVKGVLLDPLPFTDGDELVLVQQSAPKSNRAAVGVSIPELQDYRARLTSVRDLVEYHGMSFVLLNQGEPDRVDTGVVSANFFDMLGTRAVLGRTFIDTDDDLGAEPVLVLSHAYWQTKFGGDRNVVGRVLEMNNKPHTVVGVLPDYPQYPRENDVYMSTSACPFRAGQEANPTGGHRSFGGLQVFGRLRDGAALDQATAEIATVAQSFERDYAADHQRTRALGFTGQAAFLEETLVANARPLLWALAGVTMLVLLIACANVANLALARAFRRSRELAVRTALGAGRGRLVRQLMTESVLVSVAGGVIGLGIAWLSLDLLATFIGRFTARTGQIGIDSGVLAFTAISAVVTGLLFGLAPIMVTRNGLAQTMRDGTAGSGESGGRQRVRSGLVVAQVAVAFSLLVGAALMLQSFYRLSSVPLGYDADRVMTAAIFGNFSQQNVGGIETAILDRLRSSPGVRTAALTGAVPQSAIQPGTAPIQLERGNGDAGATLTADPNFISEQYFDTIGVPLRSGRDFRSTDTTDAPPVAIINTAMASFWGGSDPLGQRFTTNNLNGTGVTFTVVGVSADFRLYPVETVDQAVEAQFYVPVRQWPGTGSRLLARADGDPLSVVPAMKAAVYAADPNTPVEEIATLATVRQDAQLAAPALTAALLGAFATVALLVTLAGIAGVIGTSVSQRTRELGLRMALGASRTSVLRLILGEGAALVAIGVVIGVGGAYAFSKLIARFLFSTQPTDPLAYAGVALVFLAASLVATFGPARRATTIDPLIALRAD